MILVLSVWTFLRALLGRSTAVTLENIALRHQNWTCCSGRLLAFGSAAGTASSGSASHGSAESVNKNETVGSRD